MNTVFISHRAKVANTLYGMDLNSNSQKMHNIIKQQKTSRSRSCAGNHRGLMLKCQKTKLRDGHLGFLAAILD